MAERQDEKFGTLTAHAGRFQYRNERYTTLRGIIRAYLDKVNDMVDHEGKTYPEAIRLWNKRLGI